MEQLESLLRTEGNKFKGASKDHPPKQPKNAARAKSPRRGEHRGDETRLSLPAEWGQTFTEPEGGEVIGGQRRPEDTPAEVEEKSESWDDGAEMEADTSIEQSGEEANQSESMPDTDMPEKEPRTESAVQYEAAVRVARIKQRQEWAGKKTSTRGRSPTARSRQTAIQRKKQQADFRQRSTKIQEQMALNACSTPKTGVREDEQGQRPSGRTIGRRGAASTSPKRQADEPWSNESDGRSDDNEE
ncbi:hypothetical protein PHYPSEUDO_015525 [Phytophthora pseudosyringae]|uniref:Uncharacterized protein n=1 Tax=Phytophthora pseudosyringae TaxID=221518 RepID=A0A8T1V5R6_9STRA|nr:hypothetical protein PHYPSEUDO_015525 [Phytophthora pseudosyringae]